MLRAFCAASAAAVVFAFSVGAGAQHQHGPGALGTVHFDTTCQPGVRGDFDRAVALLHSFEFRSAIDGFNGVLTADPSCAIAYWGIALSHWGNPFAGLKTPAVLEPGRVAIQKGQSAGAPSAREKAYIGAVAELFRDYETLPQRDRTLAYEKAMEAVSSQIPRGYRSANLLRARDYPERAADRQDLREPAESHRHPRAAVQAISGSSGARALHHSRLRPARSRGTRARRRAQLREDRARRAARAAYALAHIHPGRRVGRFDFRQHRISRWRGETGMRRRGPPRDGLSGVCVSADGTGRRGTPRARSAAANCGAVRSGGSLRRGAGNRGTVRAGNHSRAIRARAQPTGPRPRRWRHGRHRSRGSMRSHASRARSAPPGPDAPTPRAWTSSSWRRCATN